MTRAKDDRGESGNGDEYAATSRVEAANVDLTVFPAEVALARGYGEKTLHALQEMGRIAEIGARFAERGRAWFDGDPEHAPRYAREALVIKIGEKVVRVSVDFERDHPQIPWSAIKTMRNRLTHDYEATDDDVVWSTITEDFPQISTWADQLLGR